MNPPGSRRFSKGFLRVVDANLNRAREGLRVCEEVARFVWLDVSLTRRCQRLRYALTRSAEALPLRGLLSCRDSIRDVGSPGRRGPGRAHRGLPDLLLANVRRVEESLRVLEEFSRCLSVSKARAFGELRFKVYDLEQNLLSKRTSLRDR